MVNKRVLINVAIFVLLVTINYTLSRNLLYAKTDSGIHASVIVFFPMVFGFWMGNIGVFIGAMLNAAILFFIAKKMVHVFQRNI